MDLDKQTDRDMIIGGKFTNGGQIPAHGSEKTNEQLISELSHSNRRMIQILNKISYLDEKSLDLKIVSKIIDQAREIISGL